jgi:hypothetical protein
MDKYIYQSSARSISVISSYASLVSLSMICFVSRIFSQIKKCFFGSSDASPLNSHNLKVGSCHAILNVELIPLCGVDTSLVLPKLAPLVIVPCVDLLLVFSLLPKFSCLNGGVLFGVLVAHGFMGSSLTLIWIGLIPSLPTLGPLIFLSYVMCKISSIYSIAWVSSTSYSSLAKPSCATTTLFFVFTLYW